MLRVVWPWWGMDTTQITSTEWDYILSLLPGDLEETCRAKLALKRRREVWAAGDLLRLCLAYGLCDMSLRKTAAWASTIGLAELSDVAVLKRLRGCEQWLGHIVAQKLAQRGLASNVPGLEVRVVDATTLTGPGAKGTDWRLHLGLDLASVTITGVRVTSAREGETFRRHSIEPGKVYLGDRGYASRTGLAWVVERRAHVVVRALFHSLALETRGGKPLKALTLLSTLERHELGDWPVWLRGSRKRHALRLVAIRKTPQAAQAEKDRLGRLASKRGERLSRESLRLAEYICVVTDLGPDQLPPVQVLELYRLRWQIELVFKRLKSLMGLGNLRAKDERLTRTYLLSKILGALLVEELSGRALSFFPWGFPLPDAARQPLASLLAVG